MPTSATRSTAALLSRQIQLVCGKGGVGKSAVACALALHFVEQGHKTLLCQVDDPGDSHHRFLGLDPIPHDVTEVEPDLFVVNLNPEQALREYALMTLKFESVYATVFENPLVRRFLRFVPSLAELNMLGKIWFHAEERQGGADRPRFDRVVVDCPATGHGLGFLNVAQVVLDVSRAGPMAEKAKAMAATLRDPARTSLHVVTLPEEMPANETMELIEQVHQTNVAPLGMIAVNMVRDPLITPEASAALDALGTLNAPTQAQAGLHDVGDRRRVREALQAHQLQRLREYAADLPMIQLPLLLTTRFSRGELRRLAIHFERSGRPA